MPSTIYAKDSILDVWQGSEWASGFKLDWPTLQFIHQIEII